MGVGEFAVVVTYAPRSTPAKKSPSRCHGGVNLDARLSGGGCYPPRGGRAMTVGRNPYRGPAPPAPPEPTPASGMPPSRFPGPPAASGAALMLLTGTACAAAAAGAAPDQETGTDNLPIEPALPSAPVACAAAPPPPSRPPRPGKPFGTTAAAFDAAPPIHPADLE